MCDARTRVLGMDLGYNTLSEDELQKVVSGESKLHMRGEVPGYAAYYGAYEDKTGDKLQRVITWLQIVYIKEMRDNE